MKKQKLIVHDWHYHNLKTHLACPINEIFRDDLGKIINHIIEIGFHAMVLYSQADPTLIAIYVDHDLFRQR